ncbi:AIPR family protein [Ruegeria arenilitoris]|uniref:AIPR family protein n=1 Tax=Ruegeria arenilitoris TaxID=1173585 RepID=UPI001C2BD9D3
MSGLKVRQLKTKIRSVFENGIDRVGIKDTDPQKEVKILSRCLAAFGVYAATGCSHEEASASVWDGGDDNGIDAAFFDQAEKQVVLVQSKWIQSGSGEPEARDIGVFIDGIRDLIEANWDAFGDRLQQKAEAISNSLMIPGVTIKILLVSTGASQIALHGTAKVNKFLTELNDGEDEALASFEVMGMREVFDGLANQAKTGKIDLNATLLDWSRVSHPHKAYFGIIDGAQLKSWWIEHGKRIVSKNIRYSLGDTDVNAQIKATATGQPELFWYFNNGITLIAEDTSRAPTAAASRSSGVFELRGASIVNGAQTVSTLAKVDDDSALGSVKVSVRIVLLKDAPESFGSDVTRTNNLQNRVEGRDFVAHDPEQNRIKGEMSLDGIDYQFHRSDDFVPSDVACDLTEVTTALACASPDAAHAVAAKTGLGRFYNDLSKAPYKAIFNPNTTGARAFNSVRVLRAVDQWILEKKSQAPKRSGYAWGLLIHGNRTLASAVFDRLAPSTIELPIPDFDPEYSKRVNEACEWAYLKMLEILEKEFPNKALAVLFKNVGSCRAIQAELKR